MTADITVDQQPDDVASFGRRRSGIQTQTRGPITGEGQTTPITHPLSPPRHFL